jgi:trans-aconitate 2-methyltransferase
VSKDTWDPALYERFRRERAQPFADLRALVRMRPAMRVVDLGCGTGELTAELAASLPDSTVLGIDSSEAMLERARPRAHDRLSFRRMDVLDFDAWGTVDLVFSHAALQWVPGHESFFSRMLDALPAGAQVAIQMPMNRAHPSHAIGEALSNEPPFRDRLDGVPLPRHALPMERYATLFHEHGFHDAVCQERIYGHVLPSSREVVTWVRATAIAPYLAALDEPERAAFLAEYETRLLASIGEHAPYFYPFRRILLWAARPS